MSSDAISAISAISVMPKNAPKRQKRPSMRASINAKCKECIYDPFHGCGSWRKQVEACTSYKCPLFGLRPVSRPKKAPLSAAYP